MHIQTLMLYKNLMALSQPCDVAGDNLDQLGEGLIDEDEGNEESENLLGKGRDVADEEAALRRHHHQDDCNEPETNPHPTGQVLKVVRLTELRGKTQTLVTCSGYYSH